jgi:hypothetical protein
VPDTLLTPEELLAGAALTHQVTIPAEILQPGTNGSGPAASSAVVLRPLTVGAFQLIMKAAKNDASLIPLLMIKESLVQPALSLEQVKGLHLGLVNHLIGQIREISGLTEKKTPPPG